MKWLTYPVPVCVLLFYVIWNELCGLFHTRWLEEITLTALELVKRTGVRIEHGDITFLQKRNK